MKCSLLTLSTYIDDEMPGERRVEVEAHLVGCSRCSAGAATLREERGRIRQLARVRVAPSSTRLMLEQLGITGAPEMAVPRPAPPPIDETPDATPWQTARSSPALPWTPRRPDLPRTPASPAPAAPPPPLPMPAAAAPAPEAVFLPPPTEEAAVSAVAGDQPDLPFDAPDAGERQWSPPVPVDTEGPQEVGPDRPRPRALDPVPAAPVDRHAADALPGDAAVPGDGWEMDLPPPLVTAPRRQPGVATVASPSPAAAIAVPPLPIPRADLARAAPAPPDPMAPPPAAPAPPAAAAAPPTRVAGGGASMLWARMRDAVAVRMALARSGDALDDAVDIVNGTAPRRGAALPGPRPPAPDAGAVELTGTPDTARRPAPATPAEPLVAVTPEPVAAPSWVPEDEPSQDAEPSWNAFAASSYANRSEEAEDAPLVAVDDTPQPRPLGRHTRALSGGGAGLGERARQAGATMVARLRRSHRSSAEVPARAAATTHVAARDRRIIAAIAAVAVIFLTALVVGHGSSAPAPATAGRGAATAAPARTSAPAASVPATGAPAVTPPRASAAPPASPPPTALTLGAGGTGFQISQLRYGQQPGYTRIVFDMGPVQGNNGASPTVTVASSGATALLVTFNGTLPAGSTGSPPPGSVISAVTLVSSSGGRTVYRIAVTHPVSATALFLTGTSPPLRFVLDLR